LVRGAVEGDGVNGRWNRFDINGHHAFGDNLHHVEAGAGEQELFSHDAREFG
jgi:hypothetical protein